MALRLALLALALAASPALAHRLVVYAYAETGEVVVEAKFDNGNPAKLGTIRLKAADETQLAEAPLDASGETRLPIPDGAADGLTVEIETDEGHSDYWILTPADLGGAQ